MLYVTTRNIDNPQTARKAMGLLRAEDGGLFVPFREIYFAPPEIWQMGELTFQEVLAKMLNLLFGTRLNPWDIEFTAGRHPVKFQKIGRRTVAGERWHNTGWTFDRLICDLTEQICGKAQNPGTWARMGVGISVLFGIFSQLYSVGILQREDTMDVAVQGDNLLDAASALMAKQWGLPVGKVVCSCKSSPGLWEILHREELRTQNLPSSREAITWTDGLELLIWLCGGPGECGRYRSALKAGKNYRPGEPAMKRLQSAVSASVISKARTRQTVPAVYGTCRYILAPEAAAAYAALLDYRAVSGSGNWGMVLCDESPALHLKDVSRTLAMEESQVLAVLNKT